MSSKTLEQNVVDLINDPHAQVWSEYSSPVRLCKRSTKIDHLITERPLKWNDDDRNDITYDISDKTFAALPEDLDELHPFSTSPKKTWELKKGSSIAEIDEVVRRNSWAQDDFYAEAPTSAQ
jgi:hypothetical protein